MRNPLRYIAATFALATAATTGALLGDDITSSADTAWGAPATTTVPEVTEPLTGNGPIATPMDTAWG